MNRIRFEECWFRYILCGHLHRVNKLATFKQGKLVCPSVIHQCVGLRMRMQTLVVQLALWVWPWSQFTLAELWTAAAPLAQHCKHKPQYGL